MPQENPKPCPFCGVLPDRCRHDGNLFWVECPACDAEGPVRPSQAEALAAWDHRVEPK